MRDNQMNPVPITPELITALANIAGVALTDERAAALAPQAEQHFALMRTLDALDAGNAEPQAEYRPAQGKDPR